MKRLNKICSFILVFALIFGTFTLLNQNDNYIFADDEEKSKKNSENNNKKGGSEKSESADSGEPELSKKEQEEKTFAEKIGAQYGEMFATRDFAKGDKSNNNRYFQSKKKFDEYFGRDSESSSFFYYEFREAFQKAYDIAYTKLMLETYQSDEIKWYELAKQYGTVEGRMAAAHDMTFEKEKNWEKAYNQLISDESVFQRFHLNRFTKTQQKDFKDQFRVFFRSTYEDSYLVFLGAEAMENTNYHYVNTEKKVISLSKPYYETTKAAIGNAAFDSQRAELIFDAGSVFDNAPVGTPMSLKFSPHFGKYNKLSHYLLPQTDVFELDLQRGVKSVNFYKSPHLKFHGFANLPESQSIGIYKWKDNRWKYIDTERVKGEGKEAAGSYLVADIGKGEYKDTAYAVFYDTTYKMPNDIVYNWAFKPLDISLRRHHVRYEVNLRPNDKITRAELAHIIYRTYYYRVENGGSETRPIDISESDEKAIMFCLNRGYFTKFADGSFKPNMLVPYEHFNVLMNRIYGQRFDIQDLAQKMLRMGHLSDLISGSNPYMSRAEAIYALYLYAD